MTIKRYPDCHALRLLGLGLALASLNTEAAEFRYEGMLTDRGLPANGRYDVALKTVPGAGSPASGARLEFPGVTIHQGRFELEFDVPGTDSEYWVELSVRAPGDTVFTEIPGRTKALSTPNIGSCWSSTGDSGSDPLVNFLGTTDAQPLDLRVHNARSLRLEPSNLLFGGLPATINLIGGSQANNTRAGVRGATIAGGGLPVGFDDPNFGSEAPNQVLDHYGTISGGSANDAGGGQLATLTDGAYASVGGGLMNKATQVAATIGGGFNNRALGVYGTVPGGNDNWATAQQATVIGGARNTASGISATVSGGRSNCAGGADSWAAGVGATVRIGTDSGDPGTGCAGVPSSGDADGDEGTFVWSDTSTSTRFQSSGPDQFLIRADGGFALNNATFLGSGDDVQFSARPFSGDVDMDLRLVPHDTTNSVSLIAESTTGTLAIIGSPTAGSNRIEVAGGTGGLATLTHGGAWNNASSRLFKSEFQPVDVSAVLARVVDLPMTTWIYTGSDEGRHMGPMAEDFRAAFGLSGNGRSISTVDADGVALAAIQGLNRKLEAENAILEARLAALEARLGAEHE